MFAAPIIAIAVIILLLWTKECLSSSNEESKPDENKEGDLVKALAKYLKED